MSNPKEPTIEWPEVEVGAPDADTIARATFPGLVRAALHEAALRLGAVAACPNFKDGGFVFGRPLATEACCGQIISGLGFAPKINLTTCIDLAEYEYFVLLTWCEGKQSVTNQTSDALMIRDRIVEVAEQLLADDTRTLPICLTLDGADNLGDPCIRLLLTFKANQVA